MGSAGRGGQGGGRQAISRQRLELDRTRLPGNPACPSSATHEPRVHGVAPHPCCPPACRCRTSVQRPPGWRGWEAPPGTPCAQTPRGTTLQWKTSNCRIIRRRRLCGQAPRGATLQWKERTLCRLVGDIGGSSSHHAVDLLWAREQARGSGSDVQSTHTRPKTACLTRAAAHVHVPVCVRPARPQQRVQQRLGPLLRIRGGGAAATGAKAVLLIRPHGRYQIQLLHRGGRGDGALRPSGWVQGCSRSRMSRQIDEQDRGGVGGFCKLDTSNLTEQQYSRLQGQACGRCPPRAACPPAPAK